MLIALPAQAQLSNGMAADVVIGQPDFDSTATNAGSGGVNRAGLNLPGAVTTDGQSLIIGDETNRRILIYNSIPTKNNALPNFVIGQPDFISNASNNGGISGRTFNSQARPTQVTRDGKLLVVDFQNERILIWNQIPQKNFSFADQVLLKSDFATQGSLTTQSGGARGSMIYFDGTFLWVSDTSNNRVLGWDGFPTQNGEAADIVLGQPDFVSNTANNGGVSARTFSSPRGVFSTGDKLFVTDRTNNRVLVWNQIPTNNFQAADIVLGQKDFFSVTANAGGLSASSMDNPYGIHSDGTRLFVSEVNNNRILIWDEIPTKNFAPADFVIGQPDFASNAVNNPRLAPSARINLPLHLTSDARRLFVTDASNNRVLVFNIGESNVVDLGPQFSQGKAVVGKVFWDVDGDGVQSGKR